MSILIVHKDDENAINDNNIANKLKENKTLITNSQAIYRISPVYLVKQNTNINNKKDNLTSNLYQFPKVKITSIGNEEDFVNQVIKGENDKNFNKEELNEKFLAHENDNIANYNEGTSIIDIDFKYDTLVDLNSTIKELKKPEDETDARKYLDEFNLLQGFIISNDPYNIKSKLFVGDLNWMDVNDETIASSESKIKFEKLNERLDNLFDIK